MKELRFRCWISINEEKFFGPGPMQLLQLIEQEGSLSKAAKAMGMSYKKAWDLVNQLNEKSSKPMVISTKGGAKGGGAEITAHGREVMAGYSALTRKIQSVISANDSLLKLI